MKKVIYTFAIYNNPPAYTEYTLKTITNYAKQVGADLKIISTINQFDPIYPKTKIILDKGAEFPHFYKLYALEEFSHSKYDKMVLIDDDILVKKNALDLFELHKNGHFLASQHICKNGTNHLAVIEKEKLGALFIETIIKYTKSTPESKFLAGQLRNIINSGLYAVDRDTAFALAGSFSAPIGDYSVFGWYDQGYILQKLAEAEIKCQEIPGGVQANPFLSNATDFWHFNGLSLDQKNSFIKKVYLSSDIF